MEKQPLPYRQLIFVCTNARPEGQRISCAGKGRCGQEILDQLKAFVKDHQLENEVRVAKSGCQEKCEIGPNVAVMPQNHFLSHVNVDDVPSIIQAYLQPKIQK